MKRLIAPILLSLALISGAGAATINGSLPFAYIGTAQTATNLGAAANVLTITAVLSSGVGLGDYAIVPAATGYGSATIDLSTIATGGGFSISGAFGDFTASSGMIVSRGCTNLSPFSCSLDIYLKGIANLTGFDSTESSFRTNFNQSGGSISGSGTLTSPALPPPPAIPEPTTLALCGSAMVALAVVARRRRA